MNQIKRILVATVSIFMLLFPAMLFANAGGEATSVAGGPAELRLTVWASEAELTTYDTVLAAFHERYPDQTVKLEAMPYGDYQTKLPMQFAAGDPPDVMYTSYRVFPDWVRKGVILDLEDRIRSSSDFDLDDYYEAPLEIFTYQDKIYGLPDQASTVVFFFNKTMFDKAGVTYPSVYADNNNWTWDTFLEVSKGLTKDTNGDGNIDQWGAQRPGYIYHMVRSFGGRVLNEDYTECVIDSPEAIEAIQYLKDLDSKYKVAPLPANVEGMGDLFLAQKIGMQLTGYWKIVALNQQDEFEWDIAPYPTGNGGQLNRIAANAFCIPKGVENEAASWNLTKYLASTEVRMQMADLGYSIPPTVSGATSADFLQPGKQPEHRRVFVDSIVYAQPEPTTPALMEINTVIDAELDLVFLEDKSVAEAVKEIEKNVNKVLKEY